MFKFWDFRIEQLASIDFISRELRPKLFFEVPTGMSLLSSIVKGSISLKPLCVVL
jgi:hypothetical protein